MPKREPNPELVRLIETIVDQRLATLMRSAPAATAFAQRFMSGRWHRRDGDGYGIFPRPGEHHVDLQQGLGGTRLDAGIPNADHSPGNIRPPHKR